MQSRRSEWQLVFWLTFAALNITAVYYLIFGTSKIQSWNDAITTTADTSKVKGPIDGEVETGEENDLERIRPKSY